MSSTERPHLHPFRLVAAAIVFLVLTIAPLAAQSPPEALGASKVVETTTQPVETTTASPPPTTTTSSSSTTTTVAPPPPTTVTTALAITAPPAPVVAATVPSGSGSGDPSDPASWDRLAQCEAGGNWAINTGNGYYGGLQFSLSSWRAVGGTGLPSEHSREIQIAMGQRLHASGGWGHWPGCSRSFGWI